jgi:hypothetical protein|tara:strand:+ start:192 stop:557 length:366 start_codon:yes stop_codon:yes gene_type:complete
MRKVVRELIAERQPHSQFVVEQVNVRQLGIGKAKDCFHNAVATAENDTTSNIKIVSGWLVGEYDKSVNGTALIQHYWNYDKEAKQYFDITPNIDDEMTHKYVVDTELMNYEVSDDELSVIH